MYLFGNYIPDSLTLRQGLSQIRGLGFRKVEDLCSKFGFSPNQRIYGMSEEAIRQLSQEISEQYLFESELRKQHRFHINKLIKIRSYRGMRHRNGLPVRGQRTRSNGKTARKKK